MNDEFNIDQQILLELSKLKKAIEYIEQAEKLVQQFQELNFDNYSRFVEILNSNNDIQNNLDSHISNLDTKIETIQNTIKKLSSDLENYEERIQEVLSSILRLENMIKNNEQEIERLKKTRWYQRIF